MARPGKKKKECEDYKKSGRREINKQLKKERHEKRLREFAEKRECGDAYKYTPNPYQKGTVEYANEAYERMHKNDSRKLPLQLWTSMTRKLSNELSARREEDRQREISRKRRGGKQD